MEAALRVVAEKLTQLIQNETALVFNFKRDFKWLKMRLTMLTYALQSADGNDGHSDVIKQWIEDVRDTLWDAQDIFDEYSLRTLYYSSYPRFIFFRYKMGRKMREVKEHYKMGRKIRQIRERMKSIMETANELKLIREAASCETTTSASAVQLDGRWKKSSMIEYGSFSVAVDINVQHIIERLDDPRVQVVAVVGMGGMGKTFLLQHVYDKVKHMYQDFVWLSVSQMYSLEQLQRDLAAQLNLNNFATSRVSCIVGAEIIHERLNGKKCLIVLDDVWRATEEDDLVRTLGVPISDNRSCKVIVTSRNKEVFSHLHPFIYEMPFLSDEDSWKLFCVHAFPYSSEHFPPTHLEMLARRIEKECGSLPLAIKIVASSMVKATTSGEWESKLHQLKQVQGLTPYDSILQILKLSYNWLPSFLKPCFIYLSFFSEDQKINCEYLINLWIIEGFIPQTEDQVAIASNYLRQLSNLCLVDVEESRSDLFMLKAKGHYCKVHDLMLELAICISRENKSAFSTEEASKENNSRCRRILLAKKDIDEKAIAESNLRCPKVVRTLSLSQNSVLNNIPPQMLSTAKVIRVLDLSHTQISTLPECIGDMKLLRLLNLSDTRLEEVPDCVRKLRSLSFLDVSGCRGLRRLPMWIGELVSLQHLDLGFKIVGHIPKGVSKLVSLRTLRSGCPLELSVEDDEYLRLEDVGNMTCLQELRIQVQSEVEMRSLTQGVLGRLVKMRTLELKCVMQGFPRIPLPESIKAMKDLQELILSGNFAVPGWIRGLENLRVLNFYGCDCSDLYPALETMPNLTDLTLYSDVNCREFPKAFGKRGGFPNLRAFRIYDFQALEELPDIEDGAMPSLEVLKVRSCGRVRKVPPGFQGLKRLRKFSFLGSGTDEDRARVRKEWSRVRVNNPHPYVDVH